MPSHTPGPWQIGQYEWLIETDGGDEIAQTDASSQNFRANARLIAAAPDLLDALQSLYDSQNGPPLLAPRHVEFWNKAMAAAKAAIARAEGKEPTDAR